MGHVPHVLIRGPWDGAVASISQDTAHHLSAVMRLEPGATISYTDGHGITGTGTYAADHIVRGEETAIARRLPQIRLAVAPPRAADRVRFLVEKAAELGVAEVLWLTTRHGRGRVPRQQKAEAWAIGALEQSRGAWRMEIGRSVDLDGLGALGGVVLAAHPGGSPLATMLATKPGEGGWVVAIGPEGGFADDEIPQGIATVDLGHRVLRVETAAIAVAAATLLGPG